MAARNLRDVGDRVEALLAELRNAADPAVTERVEELIRLLMDFYGAGLERMLELVEGDRMLVERMANDKLVGSLLVLHGIHPVPVERRILQALDRCQPSSGTIRYLGIDDDGIARLELEGTCGTCGSSADAVKTVVEKAVFDAAPELAGVVLEGAAPPPPPPTNAVSISLGATRTATNAVPVSIGRARR